MMNVFLHICLCVLCVMTSLHHWMLWSVTSSITYLDSVRDDFYNCSSGDSRARYTVYFEFLSCMAIDMSRLS